MALPVHELNVVDFAYQIINMQKEIEFLTQELSHYKELHEINMGRIKDNEKHNKQMTGIIFKAILDPESSINKGQAAIIKLQSMGESDKTSEL